MLPRRIVFPDRKSGIWGAQIELFAPRHASATWREDALIAIKPRCTGHTFLDLTPDVLNSMSAAPAGHVTRTFAGRHMLLNFQRRQCFEEL